MVRRGLGQGRQNSITCPEPVTDSIFAVLGRGFGLSGGLRGRSPFSFVALRGLRIAQRAPMTYSETGRGRNHFLIFIQAMINIMAISGIISDGDSTPFISYGGTSFCGHP